MPASRWINGVLSIVALLAVLAIYARHGERFTRESAAGRIGTGMLLAMLGFAFVWLAQLPFGVAQLWWDRRHDVSEVGYVEWILSSFFSLGGVFVFVSAAVLIAMALARPFRERWWIPGAAVFAGLGLLFTFVGPFLLGELKPLRNDRLAAQAKQLAREQGVSDIEVRVLDVDEFTDEPNAFAIGLGPTRRVVLWNTLLEPPFSDREVRVVIAHELAHHSRDHLWKLSGWYALGGAAGGVADRDRHAAPGRDVRATGRAARAAGRGGAAVRGHAGPERRVTPLRGGGGLGGAPDHP